MLLGYLYDKELSSFGRNNSILYQKTITHPGANSLVYGSIEEEFTADVNMVKYFDSNGNEVRRPKKLSNSQEAADEDESKDDSELYLNSTIYSEDGQLTVAEFYTVLISDDEAAYLGFEGYESNTSNTMWIYDKKDCVKNDWPLTGQTILRLSNNNQLHPKLQRTFSPNNQDNVYQGGCWIRGLNKDDKNLNEPIKQFKAIVKRQNGQEVNSFESVLLSNDSDWSYCEVNVNLSQIHETEKIPLEEKLLVTLIVQPLDNSQILDIDNIRWSPSYCRFLINVYNELTKQVLATLTESTFIKRLVYTGSPTFEPLALIDPAGYISEIVVIYNPDSIDQHKARILLQPLTGFHEDFSTYSFRNRWIIDNENEWFRTSECLQHYNENEINKLELDNYEENYDTFGLFFNLNRNNKTLFTINLNGHQIQFENYNLKCNSLENRKTFNKYEATFLIVTCRDRMFLWQNGELIVDRCFSGIENRKQLTFSVKGYAVLSKLLVFVDPNINITYENRFGNDVQVIQFEDNKSSIVTETIYDDLLRPSIVTKPTRIIADENNLEKNLLKLQKYFVTGVCKDTTKLLGEINEYNRNDDGYCYYLTQYADNPLNEKSEFTQPGAEYTLEHSFEFYNSTNNLTIEILFPSHMNYYQFVSKRPNGTEQIIIKDSKENKVAKVIITRSYNHLLSTYESDEKNRLIRVLPPNYHSHSSINTLKQSKSIDEQRKEWMQNDEVKLIAQKFASTFSYKGSTELVSERYTPETGKRVYIYGIEKLLRFTVLYGKLERYRIIYYNYNQWGELKGYYDDDDGIKQVEIEKLQSMADKCLQLDMKKVDVERIIYRYEDELENPKTRGNKRTDVINNTKSKYLEKCLVLPDGNLVEKKIYFEFADLKNYSLRFFKSYIGKRTKSIYYPTYYMNKIMNLYFKYNNQGMLVSVGTYDDPEKFLKFTQVKISTFISIFSH